jgi:hypothetical protein
MSRPMVGAPRQVSAARVTRVGAPADATLLPMVGCARVDAMEWSAER